MLQPAFTYTKEFLFTLACSPECLSFWLFLPGNAYGFQSLQILALALPFTSIRSGYVYLYLLSTYFY